MATVTQTVELLFTRPGAPAFTTQRGDGWVVHVDQTPTSAEAFAYSVARGLSDHPRWLHCRYLYDEVGSELFTDITQQPEYYLTRAETEILEQQADAIRRAVGPLPLMELGAGTAVKTQRLLEAWLEADGSAEYLPLDIDPSVLAQAAERLTTELPGLSVTGLATSYERGLDLLGKHQPLCLVFLGSSIGNFNLDQTDTFLARLRSCLSPDDAFLLGVDLIKDVDQLEAAYNDAAGVSEAFTRNLFHRMNRELGCEVPVDAIDHVAFWNDRLERIEIYARFREEVILELPSIDRKFRIAAGEMVLTEISRKYQLAKIESDLARFGLQLENAFTDREQRFGLLLSRRIRVTSGPARWTPFAAELRAARSQTLGLLSSLSDGQLKQQVLPILSPIAWDLCHIAEFEELWLVSAIDGLSDNGGVRDQLPDAFDAVATPRAARGELKLPAIDEIMRQLRSVRRKTLKRARTVDLEADQRLTREGFVYHLVVQHEHQHQETILQSIARMENFVYEPAYGDRSPKAPLPPDTEMVVIPSGSFPMGTNRDTDTYDNERPAHWVDVEAFWIDTAPVTAGQFLRFVDRDGYERREWWCDEGWTWRIEHQIEHPLGWRRSAVGWEVVEFGRPEPLVPTRPVQHVSWYEARAYARSVSKRLPTEAEWEKAAAWDPEARLARRFPWGDNQFEGHYANLGAEIFGPAPVGAFPGGRSFYGCHHMVGDVWEWTASELDGYPAFEAYPYPEYSAIHFGQGYRVLRGGSWATGRSVARNTFRNWDLPERRQIFAGFRCARDA
jgi:iron(II)-dependent oxidoreductase